MLHFAQFCVFQIAFARSQGSAFHLTQMCEWSCGVSTQVTQDRAAGHRQQSWWGWKDCECCVRWQKGRCRGTLSGHAALSTLVKEMHLRVWEWNSSVLDTCNVFLVKWNIFTFYFYYLHFRCGWQCRDSFCQVIFWILGHSLWASVWPLWFASLSFYPFSHFCNSHWAEFETSGSGLCVLTFPPCFLLLSVSPL